MLHIRRPQLAAFRPLPTEFADDVVRRLAGSHPVHVAARGEDGTRALVERTIALGRDVGLHAAPALAELAALALEFGERFCGSPDQAVALEILEHPRLPATLKLETLREQLRGRTRGRTLAPAGVSLSKAR